MPDEPKGFETVDEAEREIEAAHLRISNLCQRKEDCVMHVPASHNDIDLFLSDRFNWARNTIRADKAALTEQAKRIAELESNNAALLLKLWSYTAVTPEARNELGKEIVRLKLQNEKLVAYFTTIHDSLSTELNRQSSTQEPERVIRVIALLKARIADLEMTNRGLQTSLDNHQPMVDRFVDRNYFLDAEIASLKSALARAPCRRMAWPEVDGSVAVSELLTKRCGTCPPCLARAEANKEKGKVSHELECRDLRASLASVKGG